MGLTTPFLIPVPAEDASLEDKVAFGARELDNKRPSWFWDINTDQLDIRDPDDCILGQLVGAFEDGLDEFGWTIADALLRGLYFTGKNVEEDIRVYEELTSLWIAEIEHRITAVEAEKDSLLQ